MKYPVMCHQCDDTEFFTSIEMNEKFMTGTEITCPHGHKNLFINSTPRFELLFQKAIEAYKEEFYLECFQSLYAGYESFKKDFVLAYIFETSRDLEISKEIEKKINRSESINGAFQIAYFSKFNESFNYDISDKLVRFRNQVIHKGIMPNKENCNKLGNKLFEMIAHINNKLNNLETNQLSNMMITYGGIQTYYIKEGFPDYDGSNTITLHINATPASPNICFDENKITDSLFTDFIISK